MHKELSVKSRVRGDFHARFCERVRVKLPRSTRPCPVKPMLSEPLIPLYMNSRFILQKYSILSKVRHIFDISRVIKANFI